MESDSLDWEWELEWVKLEEKKKKWTENEM